MGNRMESQRAATEQNRGENQAQTNQPQMMTRGGEQGRGGTQVMTRDTGTEQQRGGLARPGALMSPFDMFRVLTQDVDRLLASFVQGDPLRAGTMARTGGATGATLATFVPTVEITTRGEDLVIEVDLPNVDQEDVEVEIDRNNLIIRGETRAQRREEDQDYVYSERVYGRFYRTIALPPGMNTDNIRAELRDDMLEIVLPGAARSLQTQRRTVAIQGGQQGIQQIGQQVAQQVGQSVQQAVQQVSQLQRQAAQAGQGTQAT